MRCYNHRMITKTLEKIKSPYIIPDTDLFMGVAPADRKYILKVRDLPSDEKPREKLIQHGPESLSIHELLAAILVTGTTKEGVLEMSHRVLREYGEKSIIAERSPEKLAADMDIPLVKACQIVAVGELGRRFYEKNSTGFSVIRSAKDVYEHVHDMHNLPKEHLRGLYLNTHNQIIHDEVISIGTINSNIVHPREVFRPGVEYNAVALVLVHNHPSGVVTPSEQDMEITNQLVEAGKIMGISVLDHVIITKDGYKSINANY
jgi:DNA repair protein RadC